MRTVERQRHEDEVIPGQDRALSDVQCNPPLFALLILFILAILVRIPFILLPPVLSEDVYRHRWDGRVLAGGVDPYAYAPSSPRLSRFRDAEASKINHPEVRSVYGPVAQGLMALLALSPAHAHITSIKTLAALFDLFVVGCLAALGASRGLGNGAALLYALHPLAVIETAGEGHLDGVGVALLLASLVALERARGRASAFLGAAAGLVKFTPWAALPALFRSLGRRSSILLAGVSLLAFAPFARSGGPLSGLTLYAKSWEGNGALYPEVVRALRFLDANSRLKSVYAALKEILGHPRVMDRGWVYLDTAWIARGLLAALFVVAVAVILHRTADPVEASGLLVAALLFVSPTLHPWYLLNVLPFALLFRWSSVAWVAGAAPLYYLASLPSGHPAWPHPGLVRAIEFLPAVALFFLVDRRRRLVA